MNTKIRAYAVMALLWGCFGMFGLASAVDNAAGASTAVSGLRQGGYVIFFRHAATEWAQNDVGPNHLSNCAAQRNLSNLGRSQAQAIGEGFRALGIPVGKVESSAYCRCLDTAKLAFGKAEPARDLSSFLPEPPQEQVRRVQSIRARLATPPSPGTNTILVSHKIMFTDATGVALEEGDAAIFKPLAGGRFELVERVKPYQWRELAAAERAQQRQEVTDKTVP